MRNYPITPSAKCQMSIGLTSADKLAARKAMANAVADIYDSTAFWQYASIIRGCADSMIVRTYEGGEEEIAYTLFCRARLCPICSWRRSLRAYNQLSRCMDYLDHQRPERPYKYILVTLTMRNCSGPDLPDMIDHLQRSFIRLRHTKDWQKAIQGALRTLEVTYNAAQDTYHPHLHLFCAVNSSYFTSSAYISQARLIDLWQRSLQVAYRPSVRIQRINETPDKHELDEVTKYVTKSAQVAISLPEAQAIDVIQTLHGALHGRKLYAPYGDVRAAFRALHLTDEDGDLLDVTDSDGSIAAEIRQDLKWTLAAYVYNPGAGYVRYDDFGLLASPDAVPLHIKHAWAQIKAVDAGVYSAPAEVAESDSDSSDPEPALISEQLTI